MKNHFLYNRIANTIKFINSGSIFDCFIEFTDNKINLMETGKHNLPRKGFIFRILSYINYMFRETRLFDKVEMDDSIVVLSNSSREYEASKFILEPEIKEKVTFIGSYPYKNSFASYLTGLMLFPILFWKLIRSEPIHRKISRYLIDQMILCTGLFYTYQRLINKESTKCIIYSNHVSPQIIVCLKIGKLENIQSIYIEHTQMINSWPKIDSDYFLLSGRNSAEKLLKKTNQKYKKIFLVGSPKLDLIKVAENNNKQISICLGAEDDMKKVASLILSIQSNITSDKILLRPHPSLDKRAYQKYLHKLNVEIKKPHDQSLINYFKSTDIIITNDSGIFFEAGYANILPLRYMLSANPIDTYSINENFLHGYIRCEERLIQIISDYRSKPFHVRQLFKKYYDNIGTEFDGSARQLGISALRQLGLVELNNENIDMAVFKESGSNISSIND